jgi:hypothetical protein
MRTTLRIDDEVMKEAKGIAAASGRTLTEVIDDLLRESLARRRATRGRERVVLPVDKGGEGLRPGLSLDDMKGIRQAMDEWDAADGR